MPVHFKPANICLIFWARLWHVNRQLQANVAGAVTEIQRIALERKKPDLSSLPEKVTECFTKRRQYLR